MANWGDLKAADRLLGQEDVTHTALSQPHWQNTRGQASVTDAAVVLFVQDSSELDYTHDNKTKNLGHIGNGKGKGLLLHSCLAVIPRPEHPMVLGVAHQKVWRRFGVIPKSETRSGRANRRTESDVWAEIVAEIGCAPVDDTAPVWVSVGE